jgi:hypothetical protein
MPDIYKEDGHTTKQVRMLVPSATRDGVVAAIILLARAIDELREWTIGEAQRLQREAEEGYKNA